MPGALSFLVLAFLATCGPAMGHPPQEEDCVVADHEMVQLRLTPQASADLRTPAPAASDPFGIGTLAYQFGDCGGLGPRSPFTLDPAEIAGDWVLVVNYQDDDCTDDLPNTAAEVEQGFQRPNAAYVGNTKVSQLGDLTDVKVCLGSSQISWCVTLSGNDLQGTILQEPRCSSVSNPAARIAMIWAGGCYDDGQDSFSSGRSFLGAMTSSASTPWTRSQSGTSTAKYNYDQVAVWHFEPWGLGMWLSDTRTGQPLREIGYWSGNHGVGANPVDTLQVYVKGNGLTLPTQAPPATSVTAFGDPHLQNIKKESFEVRRPGVFSLLNVPQGAKVPDVLLRVDASMERAGPGCSALFIQHLHIMGHWLGSVPSLNFSAGVAPPGGGLGAVFRVGNSSAMGSDDFASMMPTDMVKLTLPGKELAPPAFINHHATLMTATLGFKPGISMKVSWVLERTSSTSLARSMWVSVTGLSMVGEGIGGILGLNDHSDASLPDTTCAREGDKRGRLYSAAEVAAAASLK